MLRIIIRAAKHQTSTCTSGANSIAQRMEYNIQTFLHWPCQSSAISITYRVLHRPVSIKPTCCSKRRLLSLHTVSHQVDTCSSQIRVWWTQLMHTHQMVQNAMCEFSHCCVVHAIVALIFGLINGLTWCSQSLAISFTKPLRVWFRRRLPRGWLWEMLARVMGSLRRLCVFERPDSKKVTAPELLRPPHRVPIYIFLLVLHWHNAPAALRCNVEERP